MEKTSLLIRSYRKKHGLSCADLAKKLDLAESTLRSIENGTRPITAELAVEIERVTDAVILRRHLRPDLFVRREQATG